jgi:hypothetical protein
LNRIEGILATMIESRLALLSPMGNNSILDFETVLKFETIFPASEDLR